MHHSKRQANLPSPRTDVTVSLSLTVHTSDAHHSRYIIGSQPLSAGFPGGLCVGFHFHLEFESGGFLDIKLKFFGFCVSIFLTLHSGFEGVVGSATDFYAKHFRVVTEGNMGNMAPENLENTVVAEDRVEDSIDVVLEWLSMVDVNEKPVQDDFEEILTIRDHAAPMAPSTQNNTTSTCDGRLTPSIDLSISTKHSANHPRTPQRKTSNVVRIEEVSPTITNFTLIESVFDSPTRGARGEEDGDGDNESEISSVGSFAGDGDEWGEDFKEDHAGQFNPADAEVKACKKHQANHTVKDPETDTDAEIVNSDDTSTSTRFITEFQDAELLYLPDPETLLIPSTELQVSSTPPCGLQLVFVTSCYQCLLAGLPCSRTLPCCTRCKRSGRGHLCLMHRRKLRHEMIPGDVIWNTTPVLLKLEGENQNIWEKKVELSGAVSSFHFLTTFRVCCCRGMERLGDGEREDAECAHCSCRRDGKPTRIGRTGSFLRLSRLGGFGTRRMGGRWLWSIRAKDWVGRLSGMCGWLGRKRLSDRNGAGTLRSPRHMRFWCIWRTPGTFRSCHRCLNLRGELDWSLMVPIEWWKLD